MAQIFHRSTNYLAKASLFGALLLVGFILYLVLEVNRSDYVTGAFTAKEQPVQFSHKHHVGDAGVDCRYCHTAVEKSSSAGIPPSKTCMNCHSQLWAESPYLEPVRASFKDNKPLRWTRVHDLPDFVYFNHSIHVNKGVGCESCHGRVDRMPLMMQVASLNMEWCLDCHRNPEKNLRPQSEIYTMGYQPTGDPVEQGKQLAKLYNIQSTELLTSCSTCHR
ncbi:MAG TPA: cytochrome c3 family protein [Candidatus Kapabacteria bacterium]|nr:cytochrome c3 family protein [Candidatus Kapabacteria bacterium]